MSWELDDWVSEGTLLCECIVVAVSISEPGGLAVSCGVKALPWRNG